MLTPVIHWTFDSGKVTPNTTNLATDDSGNGNTGTLIGYSSATLDTGQINECLPFNGSSQYVKRTITLTSGNLTMAGWFKITTSGVRQLMGKWFNSGGGNTWGWKMSCIGGAFSFDYRRTGSSSDRAWSANNYTIPNNTWVHLAVTFEKNNGVLCLYVNGYLHATTIALDSGGLQQPAGDFGVGAVSDNGTFGGFCAGDIDEPYLFDGCCGASQIAGLALISAHAYAEWLGDIINNSAASAAQTFTVYSTETGIMSGFIFSKINADKAISSITIDGVAATIVDNITTSTKRGASFYGAVASPGSHAVVVNWASSSATMNTVGSFWMITGSEATPYDHTVQATAQSSPASATVNTDSSGFMLIANRDTNGNATTGFNNAIKTTDIQNGGFDRYEWGFYIPSTTQTPHTETITAGDTVTWFTQAWKALTATVDTGVEATIIFTGQAATDSVTVDDVAVAATITFTGQAGSETYSENIAFAAITFTGQGATEVILISDSGAEALITFSGQIATDIFVAAINGNVATQIIVSM